VELECLANFLWSGARFDGPGVGGAVPNLVVELVFFIWNSDLHSNIW
jgi:hypothetical protein